MNRILEFFYFLFTNKVFLSVFFAWAVSAFTKMSITLAKERNPGLSALYRSGGMPSTHTASVVGLAIAVLLSEGVGTIFIVTLAFAIVVVHDSLGVRQEAEEHAKFLNQLIKRQKFDKKYFSENIGHNLPEVVVGAIIGAVVTVIVFAI